MRYCVLTRVTDWSFEFYCDMKLWVKRIGTLPGYPFTYTMVPAYSIFAVLPGGKQGEAADGVMELHKPPLHALINFFLEFNSWPWHTAITVFFLSASSFHQSYYVITPRGLDLTHSRGHSSRRTTFAPFARNTLRVSQSQRVTTEIVLPSHIGLFPDFT